MENLGFIGLGNMGGNISRCLIDKKHQLTLYDKNKAVLDSFNGKANLAANLAEVFAKSQIVFLSLPNSDEVEGAVKESFKTDMSGKTIIDLSTSYPISTQNLYNKLKERNCSLMDVPLLAGPAEARAGTLMCMAAGDKSDFERCKPLLKEFCIKIDYVGPIGYAHTTKIMMNFTGLMYAMLLGQMFPLAEKLGIDPRELYKVMDNEIFSNWIYGFYPPKMIDRTYDMAFSLELALKDLNYMKKLYEQFDASSYTLEGGIKLLEKAVEQGKGKLDYSQLASVVYQELGL